jgi:hypothetical protein
MVAISVQAEYQSRLAVAYVVVGSVIGIVWGQSQLYQRTDAVDSWLQGNTIS